MPSTPPLSTQRPDDRVRAGSAAPLAAFGAHSVDTSWARGNTEHVPVGCSDRGVVFTHEPEAAGAGRVRHWLSDHLDRRWSCRFPYWSRRSGGRRRLHMGARGALFDWSNAAVCGRV